MAFLDWQVTFEINIKEIDDHHKYLFSLLNLVDDNIKAGASRETLAVVLNELTDYASYHFQAEEDWMVKNNYPSLSRHKEEHICFTNKVIDFNNDFKIGETDLSFEVISFLVNWLTNHILTFDASLGIFAGNTVDWKTHSFNG